MTASSPTSAPVKGRLDVEVVVEAAVVGFAEVDDALTVPTVWVPETVGGDTGHVGVGGVIDPAIVGPVVVHPGWAAATPGTTTAAATAIPAPRARRRARIMVSFFPPEAPVRPSLCPSNRSV